MDIGRDEILRRRGDDDFVLVSAQDALDYRNGHIPASVHLPEGATAEQAACVTGGPDREVAVYCAAPT